jgi:hypothetical protein
MRLRETREFAVIEGFALETMTRAGFMMLARTARTAVVTNTP